MRCEPASNGMAIAQATVSVPSFGPGGPWVALTGLRGDKQASPVDEAEVASKHPVEIKDDLVDMRVVEILVFPRQ